MKRARPGFGMPVFLLCVWLIANDSVAPGQIALGAILAIVLTLAARRLRPLQSQPRRLWLVPALVAKVFLDIARSNLAVMKIICQSRGARPPSGFVQIPIKLRDPHGLTALACILSYSPDSVWVNFDANRQMLTLHVLDASDEAAWVRLVTERYEKPLMEIFE
jgi:multicomponent K+:H+ antiporter subunit E